VKGRALQVHILPIGWEFDRAVLPFRAELKDARRQHANRIHLVVPDPKGGLGFPERVEKALKDLGYDVRLHAIDKSKNGHSIEFESTLAKVVELCHEEAYKGKNQVRINISSGSKIGAFAAGLGGMAYQQTGLVTLYYVQPESYTERENNPEKRQELWDLHGMSVGLRDVLAIPAIPLVQLERYEWQILAFLLNKGGRATRTELFEHLIPYPEADMLDFADLLPTKVAKAHKLTQTKRAAERTPKTDRPMGTLRTLHNKALGRLRSRLAGLEKRRLVEAQQKGLERLVVLTEPGTTFALLARDELSGLAKR
jgi:hypothetical protein